MIYEHPDQEWGTILAKNVLLDERILLKWLSRYFLCTVGYIRTTIVCCTVDSIVLHN